jgi:hypothetical protein
MADTTYIVLRELDNGHDWEHSWSVDAGSASEAIRKAVTESGTYVAVPARSWKPVAVTTETRTILKLEQPDTAA